MDKRVLLLIRRLTSRSTQIVLFLCFIIIMIITTMTIVVTLNRRSRVSLSAHESRESNITPTIFVVTPTYARYSQKPDLLRLCYTLQHVKNIHWIVVEDSTRKTQAVTEILSQCQGQTSTHLTAHEIKNDTKRRGIPQRNKGIDWLRAQFQQDSTVPGSVYFADDDNTYDVRLFEIIRWTSSVTVWLVGMAGGAYYEGPVCRRGKVIGFQGYWYDNRRFPLDMAAFAVNLSYLLRHPGARFSQTAPPGHIESSFLQSLNMTRNRLQVWEGDPNCQRIYVWHTQTKKVNLKPPRYLRRQRKKKRG